MIVNDIDLAAGLIHVSIRFPQGKVDEKRVQSKFREFYKLLRPAPADEQRKIHFVLQVSDPETSYTMTYDSNAEPFDELNCRKGGESLEIYPDPRR